MPAQPKNQSEDGPTCPSTRADFCKAIEERVAHIAREFRDGFVFISDYPKSVSVFGSSRFTPENPHSRKARALAGRIAKELGYAVVTGGSAGIMEAANRGAFEAGGASLGLNIKLPRVQNANRFTTASLDFSYFFARKTALSYAAEAYLFFPGGYGTLDEFFEIVTLIQTHKIHRVPIFLIGRDYWEVLDRFIRKTLYEQHAAVSRHDLELYLITDDEEEILQGIRNAPVQDGRHRHRPPAVLTSNE